MSEAVETLAKDDIGKELCSRISSLICILKNSVQYVTPLAEVIGIKPSLLKSILAAS